MQHTEHSKFSQYPLESTLNIVGTTKRLVSHMHVLDIASSGTQFCLSVCESSLCWHKFGRSGDSGTRVVSTHYQTVGKSVFSLLLNA